MITHEQFESDLRDVQVGDRRGRVIGIGPGTVRVEFEGSVQSDVENDDNLVVVTEAPPEAPTE